jgi:hypothetical protein
MMMSFGFFVFALGTAPYQDFQRQLAWRHPSTSRVGAMPAHQFTGRDEETITLSGTLLPEITGGRLSLAALEDMAEQGQAWPLIEGTGYYYGLYVITALSTTRSVFFDDGAARRIEFQLTLKRVDDTRADLLGIVSQQIRSLL